MPRFATADGTELFYKSWGEGRPVVFTSSWALSSDMWQAQMVHLAERGFRCIAYDRRGHGRSDDPGVGYEPNTLADDLGTLIEHLDLRDVVLVGHSMGCSEIVRYLTRHGARASERIARMALCSPVLPFLTRGPDNEVGVPASFFEQARATWKRDFARWIDDNAGPYVGAGLPDCEVSQGAQDWTKRDMLRTSLRAVVECNRTFVATDFRPELRKIGVPTLLIHGDTDASAPLAVSALRVRELLPKSTLVVYANAPHGLYLTHAERLSADLEDFAKRR